MVLLIGAGYYFLSGSSANVQPSLTATTSGDASAASHDLLVQLSNLHTIKLDPTLFTDPAFLALNDFGVVIPPQPSGRHNPFAEFTTIVVGGTSTVPAVVTTAVKLIPKKP